VSDRLLYKYCLPCIPVLLSATVGFLKKLAATIKQWYRNCISTVNERERWEALHSFDFERWSVRSVNERSHLFHENVPNSCLWSSASVFFMLTKEINVASVCDCNVDNLIMFGNADYHQYKTDTVLSAHTSKTSALLMSLSLTRRSSGGARCCEKLVKFLDIETHPQI